MRRWSTLLIALLAATTLIALILFRTAWPEVFLPWLLAQAGVHHVELDLVRWNDGELEIGAFTAAAPMARQQAIVSIRNATLSYRPAGLLRGKAEHLRAEQVDLHLPPPQAPPQRPVSTLLPDPADIDALLKRLSPARLPVRRLDIQRLAIHYGPENDRQQLLLNLALDATTPWPRLSITSPAREPALPQASLTIENGRLEGRLGLDLAGLRHPSLPATKRLRGTLDATIETALPPTDQAPLRLRLRLSGIHHPALSIDRLDLGLDCTPLPSGAGLMVTPTSRLILDRARTATASFTGLTAGLGGQLRHDGQGWRLDLKPQSAWEITGLQADTLRLAPVRLLDPRLELHSTPQSMHAAWSFGLPQISGRLAASCAFSAADPREGQCTLNSQGELPLTDPKNRPPLLLPPTAPVSLDSGQLSLSLRAQWRPARPLALQGRIRCANGVGAVAALPFSGLELDQQLHLAPQIASIGPGSLRIARINGPIPATDLTLRVTFRQTPLPTKGIEARLEQAGVQLLGGRAHMRDCTYNSAAVSNTCPVQLDHLDLQTLSPLLDTRVLDITGVLRGSLPLHHTAKGLSVRQGHLESDGGRIRYRPAHNPGADAVLPAYALKALGDLHYQALTADLDYEPDGELVIAARIRGVSPQLGENRPVELNLTLSQNLLSLLKSLQYSQRLSSEIDRQLKK